MHTRYLQQPEEATVATTDFGTAIIAVGESVEGVNEKLKSTFGVGTRKCSITLNEAKSNHVDINNKIYQHTPITINDKVIPRSNKPKYLGMTLDKKLGLGRNIPKKEKTRAWNKIQENILDHGKKNGHVDTK